MKVYELMTELSKLPSGARVSLFVEIVEEESDGICGEIIGIDIVNENEIQLF